VFSVLCLLPANKPDYTRNRCVTGK
jgi:hypothetical protein